MPDTEPENQTDETQDETQDETPCCLDCSRSLEDVAACEACGGEVCERCCSEHETCDSCGCRESYRSMCGYDGCGECLDCCNDHFHCHSCDSWADEACGNCDVCSDCCSCHEPYHQPAWRSWGGTFHKGSPCERNPVVRFLSCEIETQDGGSTVTNTVTKRWDIAVVEDGSVDGAEFNTAPASGDKFVAQITDLCAALSEEGGEVDHHCGLHVHVDARDLTPAALWRLCRLWAHVEAAMFGRVDPSRSASDYCHWVAGSVATVDKWDHLSPLNKLVSLVRWRKPVPIIDTDGTTLREDGCIDPHNFVGKYDVPGFRYYALNLCSWWIRGTVEFRLHHGTIRADEIIPFSVLLGSLVTQARNLTDDEVTEVTGTLSGEEALQLFAPTREVEGWIRNAANR